MAPFGIPFVCVVPHGVRRLQRIPSPFLATSGADQRSKFRSNFERGPQFSLHGVEEMSEDENSLA